VTDADACVLEFEHFNCHSHRCMFHILQTDQRRRHWRQTGYENKF